MAPVAEAGRVAQRAVVLSKVDDEERVDLKGLLRYLSFLQEGGVQICQLIHVQNSFMYGFANHHGLILKLQGGKFKRAADFLTLDFSNEGVVWRRYDQYPDMPEDVQRVDSYAVQINPATVKEYVEATQEFSLFFNNCRSFVDGVMQKVGIRDARGHIADVSDRYRGELAQI
jgi:hypothetical protein